MDHVGLHRLADPRGGGAAARPPRNDPLGGSRRAARVRRHAGLGARRRAGEDHHGRRRVGRHRHGAPAGRPHRRRRRRARHPARHRVRPRAAVRHRVAAEGTGIHRRPGAADTRADAGRVRGAGRVTRRRADGGPRRVTVVAFPDVEVLDVAGPLEVFAQAAHFRRAAYTTEILTSGASPIVCSAGVKLVPDGTIGDVRGRIDTLVVAGGRGVAEAMRDRRLLRWLARMAPRVRRLASVCSGTFLL
ncbi:MAG: hypothetical protein E6J56_06485, partial [Deltaproteobacteria bacterium]